jgi:hypothetical protein
VKCEGLSSIHRWRTRMPLFLLPYLYMQIAMSGGANVWTPPTTADDDD